MKKKLRALVLGATGLVGRECLNLLLNHPHYSEVVVLTRNSTEIYHPKLKEYKIDFDFLERWAHCFEGINHVFCCLGTTMKTARSKEAFKKVDFDIPLRCAEMAKEKKVDNFILISSIGANKKSKISYSRIKGEIEEKIGDLRLQSFSVLRPSLLLGERKENRRGERVGSFFAKKVGPLMLGPLRPYRAVSSQKVAETMISLANQESIRHGIETKVYILGKIRGKKRV